MAHNGWGEATTTLENLMREHDALPPALRLVDCSTTAQWTAGSIRQAWAETPATIGVNARMLFALDLLDHASGADTFKHYGPNHPECPARFRGLKPPRGAWWAEQNRGAK